jgi:hypothetical protein
VCIDVLYVDVEETFCRGDVCMCAASIDMREIKDLKSGRFCCSSDSNLDFNCGISWYITSFQIAYIVLAVMFLLRAAANLYAFPLQNHRYPTLSVCSKLECEFWQFSLKRYPCCLVIYD